MLLDNPYFYLSVIGLSVKIWAAHRLRQNAHAPGARLCLLFLAVVYAMAVLEIYSFYSVSNNTNLDYLLLLQLYYILIISFLLILPLLFNAIIRSKIKPIPIAGSVVMFCILFYLILDSKLILADATITPYAATRVKGEHYWMFSVFALYTFILTLLNLWHRYRETSTPEIERLKSGNLMIGFLPMVVLSLSILMLMELGLSINAAGTMPVLLSILILVMAENLRTDRILDLRVYVPWTAKAKMIRQLTKPFREVTLEPETAKGLSMEYDKSLIRTAKQMFPTQKDAAAWLGITESKMSRMLKK